MDKRNIIVIGASAGGFEAIKKIVADLPGDLEASIFIVWHMAPDIRGILPNVLNKNKKLFAAHATDHELIKPMRIYVAPPDHHLVIDNDEVRITRGPKENRFRPAVDPLFRSAALAYGPRVIGIILSGALDDGSAGLWTIKERGGMAIVQDPADAEVPSMPENALKAVEADYVIPVREIAPLLVQLTNESIPDKTETMKHDERDTREVQIALEDPAYKKDLFEFGELTPYTCPECHGVLTALKEGGRMRFRCHTGHAFSADSLLAYITQYIEESMWTAIRSVQESVMLLNHMGDHFAEDNQPRLAAMYFKKAGEAESRASQMRKIVTEHEQLTTESILQQTAEKNGDPSPNTIKSD
jgi:two-component system, chemotaxis family, protein-glutamate methylesterase/glutaminase